MHDKVDVLIIGSGASGAAVAWSLADTNMRIVCLEQGDWVRPNDHPLNRRHRECRLFSDFANSPIRRAGPADYPINDDGSPIGRACRDRWPSTRSRPTSSFISG